jgi:hypothetical protein
VILIDIWILAELPRELSPCGGWITTRLSTPCIAYASCLWSGLAIVVSVLLVRMAVIVMQAPVILLLCLINAGNLAWTTIWFIRALARDTETCCSLLYVLNPERFLQVAAMENDDDRLTPNSSPRLLRYHRGLQSDQQDWRAVGNRFEAHPASAVAGETRMCSICVELLQASECIQLTCNHVFHDACLHRWIVTSCQALSRTYGSCPECRATINFQPVTKELPV